MIVATFHCIGKYPMSMAALKSCVRYLTAVGILLSHTDLDRVTWVPYHHRMVCPHIPLKTDVPHKEGSCEYIMLCWRIVCYFQFHSSSRIVYALYI
jgi:hypothetical protein